MQKCLTDIQADFFFQFNLLGPNWLCSQGDKNDINIMAENNWCGSALQTDRQTESHYFFDIDMQIVVCYATK